MKKFASLILLVLTVLSILGTAHAGKYGFSYTVYAGGVPSKSSLIKKENSNIYAPVDVDFVRYFDSKTDDVYMRIRDRGENYATSYAHLPSGGKTSMLLRYLSGQGNYGYQYSLYTNMYSTVSGGYVVVSGSWSP